MNDITTLIPTLEDLINSAEWMKLVNWAFWFLLIVVAVGGVFCALFGKKSLINRGISGMLSTVMLYLAAIMLYVCFPTIRETLSELPFLSVQAQQIVLLNPMDMDFLTLLCPMLLRFFILTFMINLMESVWPNGVGFLSWLVWRMVSMLCALILNWVITAGITLLFPALLGKYAFLPLAAVFGGAALILLGKLVFTVLLASANPYFGAVYGFFTVNQVGNQFSKTLLTCLLSGGLLVWLNRMELASLPYSAFEGMAFIPTCLMFLLALYIFGKVFNDKK